MEVRYAKEVMELKETVEAENAEESEDAVDAENVEDVEAVKDVEYIGDDVNAVDFEATVNSKDAEAVENAVHVKDVENAMNAKDFDNTEDVENAKYAVNNCSDLISLSDLLILAKNGDEKSKEKLIKKYYGLIVHQSKGIFLNGYTFDDLVQTGIESVLKGINNFDIEKGIEGFNAYVFWSIKNNFNYLCRKEIRHNKCLSLNMVVKDGMESMDFLSADETLEEIVFKTVTSKELLFSLELLDKEELELISFLYLNEPSGKKAYLSKYAELKGKDYYYCTSLKRRALKKLKSSLH